MAITKENWEEQLCDLQDEVLRIEKKLPDILDNMRQIAIAAESDGYWRGHRDGRDTALNDMQKKEDEAK